MLSNKETEDMWRDAMLSPSAHIFQAISVLNDVGIKIVLVCNEFDILIGTVSDGDIRRGLLRGLNLNSSIMDVVNKSPLVVPTTIDSNSVLKLMGSNGVQQIPILGENQKVVGIHLWDHLSHSQILPNTMVIMAGGLGQRLKPYTENCPKPMIKVAGKPMLQHIIERANQCGFCNFIIAVNYLSEVIEDYFLDGKYFGVNIRYIRESNPLGTAGALSLIEGELEHPILVTNGDVISDIDYSDVLSFHDNSRADATMVVRQHEWQNPFGEVVVNGSEIVSLQEKPIYKSLINAGVYVISPKILTWLHHGDAINMPEIFSMARQNKCLTNAYLLHEKWIDVGRPDDLHEIQKRLSDL